MEPNKFDTKIKDLLERREIQPSKNAWSSLEKKLDETNKPSTSKWFWLSGIAATLIGVLLMVNLNSNNTKKGDLVNGTKETTNTTVNNAIISPRVSSGNDLASKDSTIVNTKKPAIKLNNKAQNSVSHEQRIYKKLYASNTTNKALNENSVNKKDALKASNKTIENTYASTQENLNNSIENDVLTESEKLLLQAFATTELNKKKNKTITASNLLDEVQNEVEESFRTKMFSKIKENVTELKTVIAERNK